MFKLDVIFVALSRLSLWTNLLNSRTMRSERLFDGADHFISSNLVTALHTQHLGTCSCFEIFDKLKYDWYEETG